MKMSHDIVLIAIVHARTMLLLVINFVNHLASLSIL